MRDAPSSPLLVSRSPDVLHRLPSPVRRRMRARVARWHGNPESETWDDATEEEGDDDRRPRCLCVYGVQYVLLKLWPVATHFHTRSGMCTNGRRGLDLAFRRMDEWHLKFEFLRRDFSHTVTQQKDVAT